MKNESELVLKNSSILLAEDDEGLREIFKKILLLYVDTVYEASNGMDAYELYLKHRPDIIITDIKMPKLNGLEFIKRLREKDKKTPVIVTSAYANQELLLESIKLSLVEYLIKPIKESDLTKVLTDCSRIISANVQTNILIELKNGCLYDYKNKNISINEKQIKLTAKEIEFFELLIEHRGSLVTKQTIEDKLYMYDEVPPSALKNLVFKLRKKLDCDIIKTVGKLGYMID
ncbi:response regulator transcription factor [Hydrogenimonas cancrithermarum]|nr:response regulator [Hydrogenimonas cancrithermarum]